MLCSSVLGSRIGTKDLKQREPGRPKEQRGSSVMKSRNEELLRGPSWETDDMSHCENSGFILPQLRRHWKFSSTGVM